MPQLDINIGFGIYIITWISCIYIICICIFILYLIIIQNKYELINEFKYNWYYYFILNLLNRFIFFCKFENILSKNWLKIFLTRIFIIYDNYFNINNALLNVFLILDEY